MMTEAGTPHFFWASMARPAIFSGTLSQGAVQVASSACAVIMSATAVTPADARRMQRAAETRVRADMLRSFACHETRSLLPEASLVWRDRTARFRSSVETRHAGTAVLADPDMVPALEFYPGR
jgi:hypothetical protein